MAQNYENTINIGIKLQPKEEVQSELQSILSYIKKDSNIDLDFNTKNLENSLKNLNNIIANLGNAIQNNLDFSKVDTKSLTSNINKAVSSVDFDTLQTSLIEQFTEEAGIKGAEKVNKAFIKTIKQYWSSGEIQNILSDALALNDKSILNMEKELTNAFKADEIKKYTGFLKEINVLTKDLKVNGQTISLANTKISDDEIKELRSKFAKMLRIDDIEGIPVDRIMQSWEQSAKKFGFTLDGVLKDQLSRLADIIVEYRNIGKYGVATQSLASNADEEQQINRITKAYLDLIEALDILDKQKDGIDAGIFNGDKEVQEINKVEQSLGGLSEATKKSLNVDNALSSFSELEKRAEEIRNSMDGLAKIKYNLGDDGALSSATISYTDNLGKVVTETMAWKNVTDDAGNTIERVFGTTSVSITDNIEKIKQAQVALQNADYTTAQKESYKILSDLLKEEYILKTKLISAEGEYKQVLEERLVEVNLLKNAQKEDISNNNLTSIKQENELLQKQAQLQEALKQAKTKNNDDIANKIQKEAEAYKKEQQAVQDLIKKQIKLLEIKKQGMLAKDSKADTSAIDEAISKYRQLNNISMKDLRNEISYINAELKSASSSADGFMGKIGKSLSSVGLYVDAGDIFRAIMNGAKDAVEYVVGVENAMIDLTRVVDMSDTQAKAFQENMHNLSLELASANEDTIATVATFSKLGYTLQEATKLGEITTKYDSAADINDINSATLSLVSTMKAYKLNVSEAQGVTDDINEVTNRYAVTATDLNEILKRSASTMSTFGNSLHENISLGTVANEIIQDSAKVGNALKSIGSRITTNSNALKELKAMGVSIEDMNGNLKSTYQIFKDIAPKIQQMKGAELASVANNLFGKEQMSVALSIVQNVEQLDKVMETLKDTTGSVDAEFARYLDSTDAKVKQLKENLGGLYSEFVNSDMTKGFLDVLNNLITTFGNLPTAVALATTALLVFKGKALTTLITDLVAVTAGETAMTVATVGLSGAMTTLTGIMTANPFGLIAVAVTAGILAIQKLNSKLDEMNDKVTPLKDSVSNISTAKSNANLVEQYEQNNRIINDASSSVEQVTEAKKKLLDIQKQLAEQYPELITGYNNEGIAITTNIKAIKNKIDEDLTGSIKEAQSNYAELFKQLNSNKITGFDRYSGNYNQSNEIEEYKQLLGLQREWTSKETKRYNELHDKLVAMNTAVTKMYSMGENVSGMQIFDFDTKQMVNAKIYFAELAKQEEIVKEQTAQCSKAFQELTSSGNVSEDTLRALNAVFPDIEFNADNVSSELAKLGYKLDEVGDSANDAQTDLEELAKSFNSLSSTNSAVDSVIEDLQKLGGITESTYGKIINNPEVLKALTAEGDTIANLTALQEANREAMKERIQQAVNTANGVSSAHKTEADSKINADNQKMQSDTDANNKMRQNSADTTNVNGDNYTTDGKNFDKVSQSKIESDGGVGTAMTTNMSNAVNALSDMYKTDLLNFQKITQAKQSMLGQLKAQLGDSASSLIKNAQTLDDVVGIRLADKMGLPSNNELVDGVGKSFGVKLGAYGKALEDASNAIKDINIKFEMPDLAKVKPHPTMVANPSKGSSGSSGSKGSKGKSDAQKAQEQAEKYAEKIQELQSNIDVDRYFDLNQALESINNEMTALKTEQAELMGADYQNSLIREIGLLESKKSALADINDEQKREAEELKNYLSQYGFYFDANGKLINSQQRLLEIQKATNAMGGNTEEELKKKQEWVNWTKELADKTEDYVNLVNSKIPDVTNQWNELGNTIKEVRLSMIESVRDKLVDAIKKDAKKEVEKLKQEVEDAQEDAKKALEEEKEAKVNILDTRIEKLKKELASLDDEDTDKRAKLAKLKEELSKWQKDDSVFSRKKIKDLQEQIASLEKEIKKDDINNQIDDLEEEKKTTKDYYSEKLDKLEEQQKAELEEKQKAWDEMLSDETAYHKADLLLKQKNMTEITRLLSSYSENFKDIGSLLGTNFAEALNQEIKSAMDSLDSIMNQSNSSGGNANNTASNSLNNNTSSGSKKDYIWVEDGANTQLYTDSTGTKSKGSLWSNGIASADKLVKGSYSNGFYEIFDQNGKSLGWVARTKVNKWNDVSAFASGGRTPSNIDGGALSVLHSNEAILNANDTKKLDDIYDFVTVSASLLDRLEGYVSLSNKVHEATMPSPDYNRILGGDNTTNNNNSKTVTIENEINITNNTKNDSYFNARSLEKMFKQQINKFA